MNNPLTQLPGPPTLYIPRGEGIGKAWDTLVDLVMNSGFIVLPRGFPSVEVRNVTIEYEEPSQFTFQNPIRRINPVFHLVELFYFLNGRTDDVLIKYTKTMSEFMNDYNRYDGSYGPSLYLHLPWAMHQLREDPMTRRAVIPILESRHLLVNAKDIPCNDLIALSIRDNKLNFNVVTRSQDLFRGFIYDTLEFQLLQYMLAQLMDYKVGTYCHHIFSLHLYNKDKELALAAKGKTHLNTSRPNIADFDNTDKFFWQFARYVSSVIDDPFNLKEDTEDITSAIANWCKRRDPPLHIGIYTYWVTEWLKKPEWSTISEASSFDKWGLGNE